MKPRKGNCFKGEGLRKEKKPPWRKKKKGPGTVNNGSLKKPFPVAKKMLRRAKTKATGEERITILKNGGK